MLKEMSIMETILPNDIRPSTEYVVVLRLMLSKMCTV